MELEQQQQHYRQTLRSLARTIRDRRRVSAQPASAERDPLVMPVMWSAEKRAFRLLAGMGVGVEFRGGIFEWDRGDVAEEMRSQRTSCVG